MNAEKVFEQVWREFIRRLEALRNQKPKVTYEQLGEMCGVSKVTTKRWLEGAGGEKTSFPDMLRYMQAVGMNIRAVIPQSQSEKEAVLESRLSEIQKELVICKDALRQAEKERDAYQIKMGRSLGNSPRPKRQPSVRPFCAWAKTVGGKDGLMGCGIEGVCHAVSSPVSAR